MGMWYAHELEMAAGYLARVLLEKKDVHYSFFYSTDEAFERIRRECGFNPEEGFEPVEGYIDEAAAVFEYEGLAERIWLDEKLIDGEPAYRIKLTELGEKKLGSGYLPKFQDLDM